MAGRRLASARLARTCGRSAGPARRGVAARESFARSHSSSTTRLNSILWLSLSAGAMLVEQAAHGLRLQKLEHQRRRRRADSPTACCPSELWNHSSTTLTAKPRFLRARISGGRKRSQTRRCSHLRWPRRTLKRAGSRSRELDHLLVEVRHAHLEAVRHRELVGVHQQLVGQRRADLQHLERAELVAAFHLGLQVRPEVDDAVACARRAAGRRGTGRRRRRPAGSRRRCW